MQITPHDNNAATITISPGESFYFKGNILTGYPHFDWCFLPPHPLGSPIMRIFYKNYFGMRNVAADTESKTVPVTGYFPRGNFHAVKVPAGKRYYVNARCLAGFSGGTPYLTTHIKLHPVFWCLREHFFTVVTGPSTILLYGKSRFEYRDDADFETARIISFDITRRLSTTTPRTDTVYSVLCNVFSDAVYCHFEDAGQTLVEVHHGGEMEEKFTMKEVFMHILAFFKF
jgi:hypothetical protein